MFDTHANSAEYLMSAGNHLSVGFNMPSALKSHSYAGVEQAQGLPPYRPRRAFLVDEYPACPENWMRSSGRVKSYFVPVKEDCGLWLDFNDCWNSPNHVAIVVSVQGVNAITGLPCKDAQLEQYRDECPKHKETFGPDRLCKKCGFAWPKQNYLPSTTTAHGHLWIDGFRARDGRVRQYVFTADEMKGVAAAIIGKDRVFALGISYFLAKQPKPPQTTHMQSRGWHSVQEGSLKMGLIGSDTLDSMDFASLDDTGSKGIACASFTCSVEAPGVSIHESDMSATTEYMKLSKGVSGPKGPKGPAGVKGRLTLGGPICANSATYTAAAPMRSVEVKKLEVKAGALIDQRVADDTCDLDYYQKEPDGLIVVNYCTEEDARKIIEAGKVDVKGNPEGFLKDVPVGNL